MTSATMWCLGRHAKIFLGGYGAQQVGAGSGRRCKTVVREVVRMVDERCHGRRPSTEVRDERTVAGRISSSRLKLFVLLRNRRSSVSVLRDSGGLRSSETYFFTSSAMY
uniref:Uncharacterized protein n=1 Tax=Anopheles farauti TaxID=69004 RepID=A0A182QM55_9DIPT